MSKAMAETKVKGLEVLMDIHYITIKDSYKIINKTKMNIILDKILEKENCLFIPKRTRNSLINQWVTNNRLYKLHIFKKRTKDCTFEDKIDPVLDILYKIFGFCKGERLWKKKKKKLPLSLALYMM